MRELTGDDGELIGRLVEIVDADRPDDPHWWLDVSGVIADAVGGCDHVAPHSDRITPDGTLPWERRGGREVVARITWMNHLRLRLAALVEAGVAEDFLVGGLRDHVARELDDRRAGPPAVPPAAAPAAVAPQSRYDQWIAEQAAGDNLELSLVARALLGADAGGDTDTDTEADAEVDLTTPPVAPVPAGHAWPAEWAAAAASISGAEVVRWRELRRARARVAP